MQSDVSEPDLASPVIELIKNIGEVTLEKGGAITRAIEAYNALTAEQQELVSNYSVLEEAYQNYSDLLAAHQSAQEFLKSEW